jgi:hypothetical protein
VNAHPNRRARSLLGALIVSLLALGLLASPASAAVAQPCGGVAQISDPNGDGHHSSSDVLGAWFSEEAGRLQAVIKVKSGTWEPEHEDADINGSGYAMIFGVNGQTAYVRARTWPHSEKPVSFDYGTYAPGSWFASAGETSGEVAYAAFGGTVAIDVPAATGAVPGARLASPFVLTYDGITGGEPDWVDQAPGGAPPNDPARGADYLVGSCGAAGGVGAGGLSAVQLQAPKQIVGAHKVKVSGRVVPAQAGVTVELTSSARGSKVSQMRTATDGSFAVRLPIRETTELRAVANGIGSQTLTVAVKSKVTLKLRRLPSGAVRLSGRIDPALPGRLLLLPVGEIEPVRARKAKGSRFAFRLGPGRLDPGRYQVVYIPRAGLAQRSTSRTVRVR